MKTASLPLHLQKTGLQLASFSSSSSDSTRLRLGSVRCSFHPPYPPAHTGHEVDLLGPPMP
jgi:hypothetical protein